jgi:5-methylcytosine-specific restriction endonuclease McrA
MEISQPMACRLIQSLRHKRSNLFALDALSILGAEPGPKPQSAAERKAKKRVKRAASRARRDQAKAVYQAPIKAIGHAVASPEFLLTFEWRKLRMVALKKYGAKCQCCGATPATGAVMNVDHIKPRKFCPELALEITNLQILCGECNHGKGNWDTTDWRNSQNL